LKPTIAVYPTPEQFTSLVSGPDEGPVVMLNLLRFKPAADAPHESLTGQQAYALYAEKMIPFVVSKGGRFIWSGRIERTVIGDSGEFFQMAALVEYPSRKAFVEIATDPYVLEIGKYRAAGLEGQWLIATTTTGI
jgi:uncharacterized protein (DUF1330 family)